MSIANIIIKMSAYGQIRYCDDRINVLHSYKNNLTLNANLKSTQKWFSTMHFCHTIHRYSKNNQYQITVGWKYTKVEV